MNRLRETWDSLPSEGRVIIWLLLSGALTELVRYLEITEIDRGILLPAINVIIYAINKRKDPVIQRLKK